MNNNTQTNNDFSAGFIIKDKTGKFKKVNENEVVDYKPVSQKNQNQQQSTDTPQINNKSESDSNISVSKPEQKSASTSFQAAPKPPLAAKKAAFIAEPDDEEEIRKHQEELDKILSETPNNASNNESDPDIIVEKIVNKFKLSFEADVYKKRFKKIAESRIKEIRSSIEAEEVLHRVKKIGGLEFSEDVAKNIVKELNNTIKDFSQKKEAHHETASTTTVSVDEEIKKQDMLASAPPAFVPIPSIPAKLEIDTKLDKQISEQSAEIQTPKVTTKVEQVAEKAQPHQKKDESVSHLYTKTSSEAMAQISKARQVESDRPQVIDIRQPASTIGPVEEIGEIDMKEFRRMGENPSSSAEKILEKIYLLEEDSWEERMKGLQSWQQSPIYKLYVEIGRASIKNGIPVAKTINQRDSEGKPSLHLEEFLAINSLNNQLVI